MAAINLEPPQAAGGYAAVPNTDKTEAPEYLHQTTSRHLGDAAAPPWFAAAIAPVTANLNILRDEVSDLRNSSNNLRNSFNELETNMAHSQRSTNKDLNSRRHDGLMSPWLQVPNAQGQYPVRFLVTYSLLSRISLSLRSRRNRCRLFPSCETKATFITLVVPTWTAILLFMPLLMLPTPHDVKRRLP